MIAPYQAGQTHATGTAPGQDRNVFNSPSNLAPMGSPAAGLGGAGFQPPVQQQQQQQPGVPQELQAGYQPNAQMVQQQQAGMPLGGQTTAYGPSSGGTYAGPGQPADLRQLQQGFQQPQQTQPQPGTGAPMLGMAGSRWQESPTPINAYIGQTGQVGQQMAGMFPQAQQAGPSPFAGWSPNVQGIQGQYQPYLGGIGG